MNRSIASGRNTTGCSALISAAAFAGILSVVSFSGGCVGSGLDYYSELVDVCDYRTASTEFILVSAPRAPLVAAAPHARDLHGRLLEGATGRLLTEHFTALVRHLPHARAERRVLAALGVGNADSLAAHV